MNDEADAVQADQTPPAAGRKKSPVDKRVKLAFGLAFLVMIGLITYFQLRGPMLGWPDDLEGALVEARQGNRPVVVFVRSFPISEMGKRMVRGTLAKAGNKEALAKGNFILVEIRFSRGAAWAGKYGVTKTPTMLVIAADGEKFHREEGFIGEVDFRRVFLQARLKQIGVLPADASPGGI